MDVETDNGNNSKNAKQGFELRKLKAEVLELEKKWWQKPSYLGTIITGIIGLITIVITIYTGLLSTQLKSIELKEQLLQIKTESYNKTIDSIKIKHTRSLDSLKNIFNESEQQKNLEIDRLKTTKDSLQKLHRFLDSQRFADFVEEFAKSFPDPKTKDSLNKN